MENQVFEYEWDEQRNELSLYVSGNYRGLLRDVVEIIPQKDGVLLKDTNGWRMGMLYRIKERRRVE